MTIEMLFTVIAAFAAITGIGVNLWNTHRKGIDDEAKKNERAISTESKVDIIYNDVKEIKAELKLKDDLHTQQTIKNAEYEHILSDHEKRLIILEKAGE